jgi:MoaA/NifB/PqqE/SkfB family radical SAM enzyme/GNAT superfamily N-acetyltransferase
VDLEIREVTGPAETRAFIRLPFDLHRDHPQWVPPLLRDERRLLDPRRNRAFSCCRTTRALAFRQGEPVGRVMGIVNPKANQRFGERAARFSLLECPDQPGVGRALLAHVEAWAARLGMERVVGPLGFCDQDPEGLMVEGFEHDPTLATYCNRPYLPGLVEAAGYAKQVDYVVYRAPVPRTTPPVYRAVLERRARRGRYRLVEFESRRELAPFVQPVLELMSETFTGAYGFVPLEPEELRGLARQYLPVIDPRFVKVVTSDGQVVGFIIGMPHLAEGLRRARGRLLPFGFVHVLRAARRTRQLDLLLGGIQAEHRGRGIDAQLGAAIFRSAAAAGLEWFDSHHELETNLRMRAEMERLGGVVYKRYRIYQKPLRGHGSVALGPIAPFSPTEPGSLRESWPTVISGQSLFRFRLRFLVGLLRYRLDRQRYPRLVLSARRGGLLKSMRNLRDMHMTKPVSFAGRVFVSLSLPGWPSAAYDRMVALGGLNVSAAGTPLKANVDLVILSITRRCGYACQHCYARPNLAGRETVSLRTWKRVVRDVQRIGASVVVFSGGEPMRRYPDLLELVREADKDLSDLHLNTSGDGVTDETALALRQAGLTAAGVGLDDADPERHDALRGRAGAHAQAVAALRSFRRAGILPYLNVCLTRDLAGSGRLFTLLELAHEVGAGFVRLVEPKPVGGYAGLAPEALFSDAERVLVTSFLIQANHDRRYRDHPPVSYQAFEEAPERLGCNMGGLCHFSVDSLGNVSPCAFVPQSFGNVQDEPFERIFARMRAAVPRPIRSGCPALNLAGEEVGATESTEPARATA